ISRVAGESDASSTPTPGRRAVVHVIAQDRVGLGRGDHGRDVLLPGGKAFERVLLVATRSCFFTARLLGHTGPVDALVRKMKGEEFRAAADPVDTESRLER